MKSKIIYSLLFLFATNAAAEGVSYPFPYMTNATNRIEILTSKSPVLDRGTLIEINSEGCAALTRLVKDPNFTLAIDHLEKHSDESLALRKAWAEQENLFDLSFVPVEKQALLDAGLDNKAVESLLSAMRDHRGSVTRGIKATEILELTEKFKKQLCDSAAELKVTETAASEARIANEQAAIRAKNFRGMSIIVGDAGLTVIMIGVAGPAGAAAAMGGAWGAASVGVGISMLTWK
ncbi:hypothetical protein [Pseudomonas sp. B21-010]|uniref:hypothetical protein n=1 Tax=Pseudomonas sp. B21-010 TaxID=2895471 RepID=UPI00215EC159|nr:hypothetical protein [Pseudomonas sp. B21-010]UVM59106.1 hypothetical protein LOY50_16215 [Pseudomonas sp. B21-010]